MVAAISRDISPATIRRIVERADGVPLFAEEMAKMAALDNEASIPATLRDLLAVRMDHMGEAKYTAQLAATLGREFDLNLLRKAFPNDPAALVHSLGVLQDAGLIWKRDDTTLQFRHTLIQEAAYQSQTKADRQAAHRRIAQVLQSDFPEIVATQPELLARHLSVGGEARQSIEYWIKAGQRAARNSANREAIGHFNSGLQDLSALSPDQERDRLELELRFNHGTAWFAAKGYGSPEAAQAYSRALELSEALGDSAALFKALWGMSLVAHANASPSRSLEIEAEMLLLAQQRNDPLQLQQTHDAMGTSTFLIGRLDEARTHFERSVALYRPSHHEAMRCDCDKNFAVSSGVLLAWVLWLSGFPVQAERAGRRALALARRVNHPNSLGYALCGAAVINRWMKRPDATERFAQEAMALSHEHGLPYWLGYGASSFGWAQAMQGLASGIAPIRQCLAGLNTGMGGLKVFFLGVLRGCEKTSQCFRGSE